MIGVYPRKLRGRTRGMCLTLRHPARTISALACAPVYDVAKFSEEVGCSCFPSTFALSLPRQPSPVETQFVSTQALAIDSRRIPRGTSPVAEKFELGSSDSRILTEFRESRTE